MQSFVVNFVVKALGIFNCALLASFFCRPSQNFPICVITHPPKWARCELIDDEFFWVILDVRQIIGRSSVLQFWCNRFHSIDGACLLNELGSP